MALQIDTPETIKVIRELARRTGQSDEHAVDVAVREQLARLRTPEEEAERRAEVREVPDMITDHGELLYDENGLPK